MKSNILIVEDEPIIAKDIEACIQRLDHNVIGIAHSSEEALDILHSRSVDIVLLDIHIGGTRDGICLLYTSPSPRDATLSRMPSSA